MNFNALGKNYLVLVKIARSAGFWMYFSRENQQNLVSDCVKEEVKSDLKGFLASEMDRMELP